MVWVTIEKEVEVDMSDFDDEDIKDEYNSRNLGGLAEDWDEHAELEKAHRFHHQGKKDEAYDILWKMCLIKLNKVV
jgi:hypothetical protein